MRAADALNRQVAVGRAGRGSSGHPAHLRPPCLDALRARTLPLQGRPQAPERPPHPALPAPHRPHPTAPALPPGAGQDSDRTTGAHLARAAAVSLLSATRPPTRRWLPPGTGPGPGQGEAKPEVRACALLPRAAPAGSPGPAQVGDRGR